MRLLVIENYYNNYCLIILNKGIILFDQIIFCKFFYDFKVNHSLINAFNLQIFIIKIDDSLHYLLFYDEAQLFVHFIFIKVFN